MYTLQGTRKFFFIIGLLSLSRTLATHESTIKRQGFFVCRGWGAGCMEAQDEASNSPQRIDMPLIKEPVFSNYKPSFPFTSGSQWGVHGKRKRFHFDLYSKIRQKHDLGQARSPTTASLKEAQRLFTWFQERQ